MSAADHVDADDPQVGAILRELVELVLAHGGRLDPDAVFVERGHDLRLELRAEHTPERPVVRVPPELLVPVAGLEWTGEDLTLARPPDHLAPPTVAALDLMLELYRACGKVQEFATSSPKVAAVGDERLAAALAGTRHAGAEAIAADARTAFLASRVIGGRRTAGSSDSGADDSDDTGGSVLMPLIDMVNHDPEGAEFLWGPPGLALRCCRPLIGPQCYARYGVDRDPLDLAINYGFTTVRSRVVNCAPVDVELSGDQRFVIRGARWAPAPRPSVQPNDAGLVLDRLTFRADQPSSARTEVSLAVRSWVLQHGGSPDEAKRRGDDVSDQVLERVADALEEVAAAARRHPGPAGALLLEAVGACLRVLEQCR